MAMLKENDDTRGEKNPPGGQEQAKKGKKKFAD